MKYFFTPGFQTASGGAMSNTSVKEQISKLIEREDQTKPLSDQEIVAILKEQGIPIARRTVAKYRNELNILPSNCGRRISQAWAFVWRATPTASRENIMLIRKRLDRSSGLNCTLNSRERRQQNAAWVSSGRGLSGLREGHADFIGDFVELVAGDGVEGFAAAFEVLVELDGFFLHRAVGFLAAADQFEIVAGRDAGMAVLVVQTEAEQHGLFLRFRGFDRLLHLNQSTRWKRRLQWGLSTRLKNASGFGLQAAESSSMFRRPERFS